MKPDHELLQQYIKTGSEEAFTEFVRRHIHLVYSAALRQVAGDVHLAQDVAQNVFTDVVRNAASLSRRENLTGWLYTSTHFAAAKIVRTENRRRQREEEFMREPSRENTSEADWQKLRPILDSAMLGLKDNDREAILLRYFENQPFAEVGTKLGVSENTARMRVERALEKLRALLAKRGITAGAGLASVISANAVQTSPVFLAANVARKSLAGAAHTGFFHAITPKIQIGLGTLIAAGIMTAFIMQQHVQRQLRIQTKTLTGQLAVVQAQNTDLSNQLAAAASDQAEADAQRNELLKLRAQLSAARLNGIPPGTTDPAQTTNNPDRPDVVVSLGTRFVTVPAALLPMLSIGWTPAGNGASVLSADQFDQLRRALIETPLSRQIENNATITGNKHPAQSASTKSYSADGTNVDIGIIFGATPYFSQDSSNYTLNLAAELKQLPDPPLSDSPQLDISNQVNLSVGQTAVLEQDIPPGWLADSLALPEGPNKLLVFVTPTNIGIAGWKIKFHPESPAANPASPEKMADAREGLNAITKFTSENQGQLPTSMSQIAPYIKDGDLDRIKKNFEVAGSGPVGQIETPSMILLLRETQPWQGSDKKWHRIFGFADGHIEVREDFHSDFE